MSGKSKKKVSGIDKVYVWAFGIIFAAIIVKAIGLGTLLYDVLIAIGSLVHIFMSIVSSEGRLKPLSLVSNLLIFIAFVTSVASLLGMSVRNRVTASIVILLLSLSFALYMYICKERAISKDNFGSVFDLITSVTLGVFVGLFGMMSVTELTDSDIGGFALVVLIVSVVITVAIRIYASVKRYKAEGSVSKFWGQVGWFLLILLLVFATVNFSVMALNYSLDDSEEGVEYSYEIIDKRTKSSRRGGRHFYLIIDRDGKRDEVSVTSERYHGSDVGDKLTMYSYEGAFGFEYYEYK